MFRSAAIISKNNRNASCLNENAKSLSSLACVPTALALKSSPTTKLTNPVLSNPILYFGLPTNRNNSNKILFGFKNNGFGSIRFFSSTKASLFDHEKFTKEFLAEVKDVPQATDPYKSSQALRKLVKSKTLLFTDMRDNPEKFFLAHRLLSSVGLGGFGIRFTVQFNLFAGSLVGLAGKEQLKMLDDIQSKGELGCFLLTEMQAGVLSGLIVETTCDWDEATQEFVLHTPSDKAAKNWISQGYTAELGVVIADLRIKGQSYGPHPFFLQLREGGTGPNASKLEPGIRIDDMGYKTVANDLDNARVWFDKVRLPKSALLNKFCDIQDNKYVQTTDQKMRIEVIGQRLMTGRQAIAEAALVCARILHMHVEQYAKSKVCNAINGETTLSAMPQLASVLAESYKQIDEMIAYTAAVENKLNHCLKNDIIPSAELIDMIAVAKIRCISVALNRCHALRMECGSFALMHGTGFELSDMLLCCKFAEGDSRILQMKLSRDRLKMLKKDGLFSAMLSALTSEESRVAVQLAQKLGPAGRDIDKMRKAMDENWELFYRLSEIIEERHIKTLKGSQFCEPIVDRMTPASNVYDHDWKSKV